MSDDAKQTVHEAIGELLDDGEIVISWVLVVDVAGPDDVRYLAHRAGGGHDGHDSPVAWTALGMLEAGVLLAREQVHACTVDLVDDEILDEDEDEDIAA